MGKQIQAEFGPDQAELKKAWHRLLDIIRELGPVAVAFSGGVDSALLLAACAIALGPDQVKAVHCGGDFTPPWEQQRAMRLASELGVELVELDARELQDEKIAANDVRRCYWCKHLRMGLLTGMAGNLGVSHVVEGSQTDDAREDRPGEKAVREHGVKSPLALAGLNKDQVRALSRAIGLSTAETPSSACLASRVPRGQALNRDALVRIAEAEAVLHRHLSGRLRVRDHFPIARIELEPEQLTKATVDPLRATISRACRQAGYEYACLDLRGYRTGGGDGPA